MTNLHQTAINYLDHTENSIETDREIAHLVQIFHHFYRRITLGRLDHEEPFGSFGMLAAVSVHMNIITANEVSGTITTYMTLAAIQASEDHIESYFEERLSVICATIERFVREKKDLEDLSDYDPEGRTGDNFVQMIRDPLRQHVGCLLEELLLNVSPSHNDAVDLDVHLESRLLEFYGGIAKFFSYASPLLSYYFIPDIEDNEEGDEDLDVPEYITNHDFSNYEDDDWFSREYVLFEVQDVVHGPSHAELNDVSILTATSIDCQCFICGEDGAEMRKLKVHGCSLATKTFARST
ncbi:hypothetical protein DDE83_002634 [Stemphylium lycopersici]|uniref:Uncharacterized protein n=1 Tax=Stemphylium lycopersici TaxID=183478 RepID=A0A364N9S0_STELY|nr:hypothetical protein DDE83_002634 [Stemphylium lycopersici]